MERRPLQRLGALIASGVCVLMLISCNGSTGQPGTNGQNGKDGQNGQNGTNGTAPAINVASLTQDEWAALSLSGKVLGVKMTGADSGTPQVTFTVTNSNGVPVVGLSANTTKSVSSTTSAVYSSYSNFAFTIAKLVQGPGGTSQWVSYIINSTPTMNNATKVVSSNPQHPGSDNSGTLTEDPNIPGNYTYTFFRDVAQAATFAAGATYTAPATAAQLGDLTYDPALTHRLAVEVSGNFRGTGTNTPDTTGGAPAVPLHDPANLIYDFVPSTGQPVTASNPGRVIVTEAACNACHTKLNSFHGGNRVDPLYCGQCHNDQQQFGAPDALPDAMANVVNGAPTFPAKYTGKTAATSVLNVGGMATGNFPAFVHRLHMGSNLTNQNYQFNSSVNFNNTTYPQDVRNCTTCHSPKSAATPQGDNWKTVPSIVACGSCHDNVNFVTGAGHGPSNKAQADGTCQGCHQPSDIQIEHTPVLNNTQFGAATKVWAATNPANLPTNIPTTTSGTDNVHSFTAVISSVKIVPIATDNINLGNPAITFSLYMDGGTTPVVLNQTPSSTSALNMIGTNFVGGPNVMVALAYPQDGIAPADYNYEKTWPLVNFWNGSLATTGTLTGSNGVYTVTLTGLVVPPGTTMLIGGLGDGSTLTQTNLTTIGGPTSANPNWPLLNFAYTTASNQGGVLVPFPTTWQNAASFQTQNPKNPNLTATQVAAITNSLQRRSIIKTGSCNSCHSNLGAFTNTTFHSAANNDPATCAICHNTTGGHVANGWSINAKVWMHGLHSAGFRNYPYNAQTNFPGITYPGILNDCEACHVPGSYDFSNTTNAGQVPNMLWDTVAVGKAATPIPYTTANSVLMPLSAQGVALPALASGVSYIAPWIVLGTNYGTSAMVGSWTAAATPTVLTFAQPSAGTAVVSPLTAACASCHDSPAATNHMTLTGGGVLYKQRSAVAGYGSNVTTNGVTAFVPATWNVNGVTGNVTVGAVTTPTYGPLVSTEQCLICHGPGKVADIRTAHMNF